MTFEELAKNLSVEGFDETPSEIHGLLCGRIAGGERIAGDKLGAALVESLNAEEELVDNALPALQQLYASIIERFERPDFSFQPLLPGDDSLLAARVMALSEWCQCFISGLGESGLRAETALSEEVAAAIADLAAIARVAYDGEGEEEDEADLFELEEYVRMAAMVIYSEFNAAPSPSVTLH